MGESQRHREGKNKNPCPALSDNKVGLCPGTGNLEVACMSWRLDPVSAGWPACVETIATTDMPLKKKLTNYFRARNCS